jgi:general secretion pathway protein E/type IV pilus assembly protein PilB
MDIRTLFDEGQVIMLSTSHIPEFGMVNQAVLTRAREAQSTDGRLSCVFSELGFSSEEQLLHAVAQKMGYEFMELAALKFDRNILKEFPLKLIHRYNVYPLRRFENTLYLATSNPFDLHAADAVGAATGLSVMPVIMLPDELAMLIKAQLGVGAETIDDLMAQADDQEGGVHVLGESDSDGSDSDDPSQEASVVRLVNEILLEAIESHASDIHLESQNGGIRIRYRIDGVLHTQPTPPEINRFHAAIISRLKIMARLNIAEKRVPQDGRIKLKTAGREVDVRVSIIPMLYGEGIVMRILDKDRMNFSLRGIGMDPDIYARFQHLISLPHGVVLVTGPTGSGKTTTLYSALNEIKSDDTKIITTEDPIEYHLDGINQIQVQPKVGLTFAASLRSILRHDPDVILIGEIRDLETAENAVQAALTGHLVFSTLHTNDAAGAFLRMVDMGVEPFLISSCVEGVLAQRLVRTLCRECREQFIPTAEEVPADFPLEECIKGGRGLYRPVGCRQCRGTGYRGRAGIYELLETNDEVRRLAAERAPTHIVAKAAMDAGMQTLRQNGWRKVRQGVTTIDEVLRVTKAD